MARCSPCPRRTATTGSASWTSWKPSRSTSSARSSPSSRSPCCCSRAARTPSSCCTWPTKAFYPAKIPFPDPARRHRTTTSPRSSRPATAAVARLGVNLVVGEHRRRRSRTAIIAGAPPTVTRNRAADPHRCSNAIAGERLRPPPSVAVAVTRRRPAPRSASTRHRDEFGQWDPKQPAPRAVEPLQRPPAPRASTCASSRSRNWTELDVWRLHRAARTSSSRSIYYAHQRRRLRARRHADERDPAQPAARGRGRRASAPSATAPCGDMTLHRLRRVGRAPTIADDRRRGRRCHASPSAARPAATTAFSEAAMEDRKKEGYF